jgi:hypothetical protein
LNLHATKQIERTPNGEVNFTPAQSIHYGEIIKGSSTARISDWDRTMSPEKFHEALVYAFTFTFRIGGVH